MRATLSLRSSNPPSHTGDSRKYVNTKASTRTHIYTYTRAHIKHLTRAEAFGDKATGRRDERKRQTNGKKEHRRSGRFMAYMRHEQGY